MTRSSGSFRGAVDSVLDSWQRLSRSALGALARGPRASFSDRDAAYVRAQLQACLEARGGEVSARHRAAELGMVYLRLDPAGKERFLRLLADFADTPAARVALLRQFNSLPFGVKFLVDVRADLLAIKHRDEPLRRLEEELRELLASWFDLGFLELRRITWDAPASLLERLASYEAVHAIKTWLDFKNRLDDDRRCFAFFHPVMPLEPLIFVEVALVDDISERIRPLLDHRAPLGDASGASTAVFYSISNCQRGLAGISFGNALIKQVVVALRRDFPNLRTFATLSPMPGFRAWFDRTAKAGALAQTVARAGWQHDASVVDAVREPLLRLAAHYLVDERGTNRTALDPVAHFHLGNGARLERINWMADPSARGLRESFGMMVNYVYSPTEIDENHEIYAGEERVVASPRVLALARERVPRQRRAAR